MRIWNILVPLVLVTLVGISAASTTVTTTATVDSSISWTGPSGVTFTPNLKASLGQPQQQADSFVAGCTGPFEVVAEASDDWALAATGKMVEWDDILGIKFDGHILGTPMHLIGTEIGDKNLGAIKVQLLESAGNAPQTYNFKWSQTVLWTDYPETPYKLKVKFSLNPIYT